MLCIKKSDEGTDGLTDGRTEGQTNNPEAICPSNFFEVEGIMMKQFCVYSTCPGIVYVAAVFSN